MVRIESAVHRTILVVDVEKFGAPDRTDRHQVAVRAGVYRALRRAFAKADIPWRRCHREDRGDGVFVLAPPDVPKARFVEQLPGELVRALREHNSTHAPEERIRLRMSLHAGEIRYDDHGVTGTAINLAFRLLDSSPSKSALAASSGVLAVIVSSWFFEEVVRHGAIGPDTFHPVRVELKETVAVGWIGLPDDPRPIVETGTAPPEPAAPRPGVRRTLPRDTNAFTGRTDEVARLLAAAEARDQSAVVAIDGMAGVGKTALAVHAAHRMADRFPDGQLFLRLHAHSDGRNPLDPSEALASLLSGVGFDAKHMPTSLDDRAALWRDHLSGRRVLLVLDDAAGPQQVEHLLPPTAGCLTLITSRRRLTSLDNAMTLTLGTLPPHDGAALFVRLSGREAAGAGPVGELVRLGGHLPLAISLLAGRLRHHPSWTVEDLVDDVRTARDRLGEIRAENVAVATALDLSYRNLSADGQLLFHRLGLHPGVDLDAHSAAALADIPLSDARALLRGLYDDHLLDEPSRDRYRMHDLVREYSRAVGGGDGAAEHRQVLDRLFSYYRRTAAAADDLISDDAVSYLLIPPHRPLGTGESHLTTATEAWAWIRAERSNLIACLLDAANRAEHRHVVDLAEAMTTILDTNGPWDKAALVQEVAVAAARHIGDTAREATSLVHLGHYRARTGNYRGAIDTLTQGLHAHRELGRPQGQILALIGVGAARRQLDDYTGAAEAHTQALELARAEGSREHEANALNELGIVRQAQGDLAAAATAHTRALDIYETLGHRRGQADARVELGLVRRATGNHAAALELLSRAAADFHELSDSFNEAFALNHLGTVLRLTGDPGEAIGTHLTALRVSAAWGDRLGHAVGLNELGAAYRVAGDHPAAAEAHRQALDIYQTIGHRTGVAETLNQQGNLLLATGTPHEAWDRYNLALRIAREIHVPLEEARALDGLGNCATALSQPDTALSCFRQALEIFERIGAAEAAETAERVKSGRLRAPATRLQ
ncbi:ATP-binding protein [Saccharothrix deserti]|uniref:ATP-binding protein n=1 Tax=Saccharothrix deserti TaxID=2593674 RepID=UPI00131E59EA|nr:tetratricopeptide repeat protein [Saccharothrix deserti]